MLHKIKREFWFRCHYGIDRARQILRCWNNDNIVLTAREGFLLQPNALIYMQGGAAFTSTNVTVFNLAGTQIGNFSNSSQGWALGGGAKWMFAPHWSVFAEYNFMGFGGSIIQNAVAGVNYKF